MPKKPKQVNAREAKKRLWRNDVQNRLEREIEHKRPVTKEDKWCRIKSFMKEEDLESEAPYGYVIIIPQYFNHMDISEINGIIIRNKCIKGKIYLQVVEGEDRRYAIRIKKNKNNHNGKDEKYLIIKNKDKRKF